LIFGNELALSRAALEGGGIVTGGFRRAIRQ
jgi:hypothetical protein